MTTYRLGGQTQTLACADLTRGGDTVLCDLVAGRPVDIVYSDPPWNPGNQKYWRRMAGVVDDADPTREPSYQELLDAWCRAVAALRPRHVFVEQSAIPRHKSLLLATIERCRPWTLPMRGEWVCRYGHPARDNALLHLTHGEALPTAPSGLSGRQLVRTVFRGVMVGPGSLVVDPCMGLGTTSKTAHEFGADCAGIELNAARLARTTAWLECRGYAVT